MTMVALMTFGVYNQSFAQKSGADKKQDATTSKVETTKVADTTAIDTTADEKAAESIAAEEDAANQHESFNQLLKRYFIEGGAQFMSFILLALIIGLALVIERIIYLNLATTNTKKLLSKVEASLQSGGVESAKEICRNTRGPVASIFYQGLLKYDDGLEQVEKSIVSYGSVMMGQLEKGLSWISLFIALAPMLGFLGTVIGMIEAFDQIQQAGDISPTIVAGGIKVALLTTVFGLIVAMVLQIFYNYIVSKVDSLVNDMEDSSINFMDVLAANKK